MDRPPVAPRVQQNMIKSWQPTKKNYLFFYYLFIIQSTKGEWLTNSSFKSRLIFGTDRELLPQFDNLYHFVSLCDLKPTI